MRVRTLAARLGRAHTRIGVRLLLFNLLLVFLPAAAVVYLDAYEQHLLAQQERAMADAGRLVAVMFENQALDPATADPLLARAATPDMRVRLVTPDGIVVGDSMRLADSEPPAPMDSTYDSLARPLRSSWLYRLGAWLGRRWKGIFGPEGELSSADSIAVGPDRLSAAEVARAIERGYGAATRLSPGGERSVTLFTALPIRTSTGVAGVVLVSQSTRQILQRLYDVRLRVFQIVIASVLFALGLTAIASMTIVRPLRQLRDDAESVVDRRGRLARRFRGTHRRDEIGELTRSVEDLTTRLEGHLRFFEQFGADVTHELRNPLASIRASAEMLAAADRPADRERFRARIERDISRLELLLTELREVTTVDAKLEEEPRAEIDLRSLVKELVDETGGPIAFETADAPVIVSAAAGRLAQVLRNLVENARSFSPPDSAIDVAVGRRDRTAFVRIRDRGPGIAPEHLSRIFERFFSHRPDQPDARQIHTGLGLSIAQTIAHSYGGSIAASNHAEGGAVLELTLPIAKG